MDGIQFRLRRDRSGTAEDVRGLERSDAPRAHDYEPRLDQHRYRGKSVSEPVPWLYRKPDRGSARNKGYRATARIGGLQRGGIQERLGCHHGRWRDVTLLERRS